MNHLDPIFLHLLIFDSYSYSHCFLYCPDKGVVFGMPLTEEGIAQIYQLIMYLIKSKSAIFNFICLQSHHVIKCMILVFYGI